MTRDRESVKRLTFASNGIGLIQSTAIVPFRFERIENSAVGNVSALLPILNLFYSQSSGCLILSKVEWGALLPFQLEPFLTICQPRRRAKVIRFRID